MGRFDVALCLVPLVCESGVDNVSGEEFRLAFGDLLDCVDHVMSNATPRCVASAVAECIRSAPVFSHQMVALISSEESQEMLATLICDLTRRQNDEDDIPLQCMFFASNGALVTCEIIGQDRMKSVSELTREMRHIVLVALKYKRRMVIVTIAEQLSTTLIASMLGSTWCSMWLVLGGHMTMERSVSVLREALAVRDAVRNFSRPLNFSLEGVEEMRALLQARAASIEESQYLVEWWQQHVHEDETTSAYQRLAEESTVLQIARTDLQRILKELDEFFARQLGETKREIACARQGLREVEAKGLKLNGDKKRITELELRLAEKDEELCLQRDYVVTHQLEANDQIQELLLKYDAGLEEMRDANSFHEKEDIIDKLRGELLKTQMAMRNMQRRWEELREENLQNAAEFHQREKDWQAELKREEEERDVFVEECQKLRTLVNTQGSGMSIVKETIQATRALEERELDDLLDKVRAISSANVFATHRRVSPNTVLRPELRSRPRIVSPTPIEKTSILP